MPLHGLTSARDLTPGYVWTGLPVLSFPGTNAFLRCPSYLTMASERVCRENGFYRHYNSLKVVGSKFEAERELLSVQVAMSTGENVTSHFKNTSSGGFLAIELLLQKILLSRV